MIWVTAVCAVFASLTSVNNQNRAKTSSTQNGQPNGNDTQTLKSGNGNNPTREQDMADDNRTQRARAFLHKVAPARRDKLQDMIAVAKRALLAASANSRWSRRSKARTWLPNCWNGECRVTRIRRLRLVHLASGKMRMRAGGWVTNARAGDPSAARLGVPIHPVDRHWTAVRLTCRP
jgi:hypothetical protein